MTNAVRVQRLEMLLGFVRAEEQELRKLLAEPEGLRVTRVRLDTERRADEFSGWAEALVETLEEVRHG